MNEDSEQFATLFIKEELRDCGNHIKELFFNHFSIQLEFFTENMSLAYLAWKAFDKKVGKNIELAHISSLIYSTINNHLLSMKLLTSGYFVAAGNTYRQTLESAAMSLLFSDIELGYLGKYINGEYHSNKVCGDIIHHHKRLNLNRESLKTLQKNIKFYNRFSHTTHMTVASSFYFEKEKSLIFGTEFDPKKIPYYEKEINSRVNFTSIIPNIIDGVKVNLGKQPKK